MNYPRALKTIFFLAGLTVLYFLFQRLGAGNVVERISQMGWPLLLVLFFPITAQHILFVYGWRLAIPGKRTSFWNLFQVHLLGEAFNYIIPSGQIGGEPMKAISLRKEMGGVPALGSVIAAKTVRTLAMFLFILAGILLAIRHHLLSPEFKKAALATVLLFLAFCLLFLFFQRRGLFGALARFMEKRSFPIPAGYKNKIAQWDTLDADLKKFYTGGGQKFLFSLFLFTAGWAVGFLEVCLFLHLLGVPSSLSTAVVIEAFSLMINTALFFVPGGVGTQEGGKVFIFKILSMDPVAGLAMGLARRLREMTWVALGLIVFAYWPLYMKGTSSK